MANFQLPPIGFGPGSQPEVDGELEYMALPSGMRTYSPHLPDIRDMTSVGPALATLADVGAACDAASLDLGQDGFDIDARGGHQGLGQCLGGREGGGGIPSEAGALNDAADQRIAVGVGAGGS